MSKFVNISYVSLPFLYVKKVASFIILILIKKRILWVTNAGDDVDFEGKLYQLPLIIPVATSEPFFDRFHKEASDGIHCLLLSSGKHPRLKEIQNLKL